MYVNLSYLRHSRIFGPSHTKTPLNDFLFSWNHPHPSVILCLCVGVLLAFFYGTFPGSRRVFRDTRGINPPWPRCQNQFRGWSSVNLCDSCVRGILNVPGSLFSVKLLLPPPFHAFVLCICFTLLRKLSIHSICYPYRFQWKSYVIFRLCRDWWVSVVFHGWQSTISKIPNLKSIYFTLCTRSWCRKMYYKTSPLP